MSHTGVRTTCECLIEFVVAGGARIEKNKGDTNNDGRVDGNDSWLRILCRKSFSIVVYDSKRQPEEPSRLSFLKKEKKRKTKQLMINLLSHFGQETVDSDSHIFKA